MKVEYASVPAGRINEDYVGIAENTWWVLDGSQPPGHKPLTRNDAEWFVKELSHELHKRVFSDDTLINVVEGAFSAVSEKYYSMNPSDDFPPISTISIARLRNDPLGVEVFRIGNSPLYACVTNGVRTIEKEFVDSDVNPFEQELIRRLIEYKKSGMSYADARRALGKDIQEFVRKYLNKEGGYHALAPGHASIVQTAGTYEFITLPEIEEVKILILSDGMYRIIEPFKRFPSMRDLSRFIENEGIRPVVNMVRSFSFLDPNVDRWPRVKWLDDTSGVYVHIHL